MDRQKKLILVGATALLLVIMIILLVVLVVSNSRNQPEPPEPTPIETIEPIATPTEAPLPTPETTPEPTPVAPVETPTPEPEETPEASPEAGAPTLPGNSSNTPKPTQKPATTAAPSFDFSMLSTATVGAKLSVTVSAKSIASVEWILIKKGDIEIEVSANSTSDANAALTKDGGSIAFKNAGSYMLKGIAITTEGLKHTVSRNIEVLAASTTTPPGNTSNPGSAAAMGGFAFGLPKTAYTDTVVTVSVPAGTEAITWSVTKDGSEIALADVFTGTLKDDGGIVVFKSEGKYVLTGTTTGGKTHAATIEVKKRSQA
ncbi:hypothetical protein LJC27_05525 [Christensenellaceae bacterium OttesenSCG-928-M15]|nr:hypothetical protein [Christensenellaceae bacterium OttesenSCG-928-M15]